MCSDLSAFNDGNSNIRSFYTVQNICFGSKGHSFRSAPYNAYFLGHASPDNLPLVIMGLMHIHFTMARNREAMRIEPFC